MQSRATLERRNCVSRPADAAISFSPIKSDVSGVGLKLGCAVDAMKKRSAWISIQHPANEDTPTTVRKPELARIQYAISPTIAASRELIGSLRISFTLIQAQRKRDNFHRYEERRIGKECCSQCSSQWTPFH